MRKLLMFCLLLIAGVTLGGCNPQVPDKNDYPTECNEDQELVGDTCVDKTEELVCDKYYKEEDGVCVEDQPPVFSGDSTTTLNSDLSYTLNISVFDSEDGDLSDRVFEVSNLIDITVPGDYEVVYGVVDSAYNYVEYSVMFTVPSLSISSPTGFIDLGRLDEEVYARYIAAAEKYLYDQLIAGIPLYDSASLVQFSDRVELPLDSYVPYLGFGSLFGELTDVDANVKFPSYYTPIGGDKTYRTTVDYYSSTYNQWFSETSLDERYMELMYGSLYRYMPNEEGNGFELAHYMASGDPFNNGDLEYSTTWKIPLGPAQWKFHPNTDSAFLSTNPNMDITSEDYIETFKLAMDNIWLRAYSGGNDFCSGTYEIEGACEYRKDIQLDQAVDFNTVGIKALDDATLEFTFVEEKSMFEVKQFLSSSLISPIHIELYNYLQDGDENNYASSISTVGYSGPYYIKEETNNYVKFDLNTSSLAQSIYNYDSIVMFLESDITVQYQLFTEGYLDETVVPNFEVDSIDFENDNVFYVPGSGKFSLQYNGTKTQERLQEIFPDSDYIPEPILGNNSFIEAMFYAINRDEMISSIHSTNTPAIGYYPDYYFMFPELGTYYRETMEGQSVYNNLNPETLGYNSERALELFKKAVGDLIEEGYYTAGTTSEYTVIELDLFYYSNSAFHLALSEYIEMYFEDTFIDDEHYVKIEVSPYAKDYPSIYYDHYFLGKYDLTTFGFSTSVLCPGVLYSFDDNCYGNFNDPMVYEVDLDEPEIVILNENNEIELWSYKALLSAIYGESTIVDGVLLYDIDIEVSEFTPTSFKVELDVVNDVVQNNILITIQEWDANDAEYQNVAGFEDVEYQGVPITFVGLKPGFNDYPTNYRGDYRILLTYDETIGDRDNLVEVASDWWLNPSTITAAIDSSTDTTINLDLELFETFEETIVSVKVLDDAYEYVQDAVVDGLNITSDNLNSKTLYYLEITYTNNVIDYYLVITK